MEKHERAFAWLCVLALVLSTLPLYAISLYNHPYYDDYGFSQGVHQAWQSTHSLSAALRAALESAANTRIYWQGTYTGTLLSNLQPGLFSEKLYWVGSFVLLTALVVCMGAFFCTAFGAMGLRRASRISLSSLATLLMIQFIPDVGEAFFWYNGGIGNTFVYALIALAAAQVIRLLRTPGRGIGRTAGLMVLAVLLGGGSYGGGLFTLCLCVVLLGWLFVRRHAKRWHVAAVALVFALCFAYSITAKGNVMRSWTIGYHVHPAKAIAQALYYGVALMGSYLRLPLLAVTALFVPAMAEAAKRSPYRFAHPWLATLLGVCLYAAQLTPPLYAIASIGAGRIENTYFICFVALWFPYVYYVTGALVKRAGAPVPKRSGALLLAVLCAFGMGCLAFRRGGDVLYGVQNLSGPSAALSLVTGEAARYDREMTQREALFNDETQPVITLKPLSVTPKVFMSDLLAQDTVYDVRPVLCGYYGKEAIEMEGQVTDR